MIQAAPDEPPFAELLLARARSEPTTPRLTWYDVAGRARVELSGASLSNAVAKTTGLLVNELGAASGSRVELMLPAHWQLAVWLLASWSAGCVVSVRGIADPAPAEPPAVTVIGPEDVETRARLCFDRGCDDVVAVSLDPLGAPFRSQLPAMVIDHAVAARAQPDEFVPLPMPPTAPVWAGSAGVTSTGQELCDLAERRQPTSGWQPGDRLWHMDPVDTLDQVVGALVAPLLNGASLLWRRNPAAAAIVTTVAAEQVTVVSRATTDLPTAVRVLAGAPVSS
jgi:uncharacterized protein (TIGR03089 family)